MVAEDLPCGVVSLGRGDSGKGRGREEGGGVGGREVGRGKTWGRVKLPGWKRWDQRCLIFESNSWEVLLRKLTKLAQRVPGTIPLGKYLHKLD